MNKRSNRALFVNIFGALGYITCLILWGWTGIIYVPLLLENEQIEQFLIPPPSEIVADPQVSAGPSPITTILAVVITIVVLIATIIIVLKAPKTIATAGKTVTTKAAGSALPLITKGQKLTPAKKQRLTARLIKFVKLLIVTVPVAIGFLGIFIELPLPLDFVMLISSILAICALIWFSAQYSFARILGVDPKLLI